MSKYIEVDGVEGLVEVPDDITDEQILDVGERLTQGRVSSAAGAMMRQGGSMWGKAAQALSRTAQILGNSGISIGPGGAIFASPDAAMAGARMTGAEKQKQLEEDPTYQFGENLAAGAEESFPVNPIHADKWDHAVASGVGSVFALTPAAPFGPAAPLIAGGGYGLSAGESAAEDAQAILDRRIQTALEQGDVNTAAQLEQDKFSIETAAFLATAPIGAGTEGVLGVAGRLAGMARGKGGALGGLTDKVVGSMAKSQTVKRGAEGLVSESLQEGLEQVGGNVVAKGLYDPDRDLTEGVGMSMVAGGIVGGGFGAGAGALADRSARINPVEPTVPEAAIAPESANEVQAMLDALAKANEVTKDNFTDEEAISQPMEVPVDVTPAPEEAPVDIPPPPPVDEQADLQAELDAQVNAGTVEEPPVPETLEQVSAQLEATLDPESTKAVTLVTPETQLPEIPEGLEVGEPTEAGIPIFNPEKITPELVTEAGQGEAQQPETVAENPVPEVNISAQQAAVPGGVTEVKPAAEVVAKRIDSDAVDQEVVKTPFNTKNTFKSEAVDRWGKRGPVTVTVRNNHSYNVKFDNTGGYYEIRLPKDKKIDSIETLKKLFDSGVRLTGKVDEYGLLLGTVEKLSPVPSSSTSQAKPSSEPTPAVEAPTQGQTTPTPPGSAPSPDAGTQGVGVQSVEAIENLTKTRDQLEAKRKAEDAKPRKYGLRSKKAIDLNREIDALDLKIAELKKAAQEIVQSKQPDIPKDLEAEIEKQKTGTGPLTGEERSELNELRLVKENRGKLSMLAQARVDHLESREKLESKVEAPIANPAESAVEPVKAQVEEVSKTEKQKQSLPPMAPKAQKQYLLDETEKAIAEAPDEAPMESEAAIDRKAIKAIYRNEAERLPKLTPYFEKYGIKRKAGQSLEIAEIELNEAVMEAYFDQADKVRIEVPGDGIFTILNNKKALTEFYERAKKFPTTTPKAKTASTPRTDQAALPAAGSMTKPNVLKALASHLSENEDRPIIELIYSDGDQAVATDGRRMLIVDTNLGGSKKTPVTLSKDGVPKKIDKDYPNWKQVLPDPKSYEATIGKVNIRRLWGVLRQAKEATDEITKSVVLYLNSDKTFGVRAVKPESGSTKQGDFSPGMSYVHNVTPKSVIIGLYDVNFMLDALESHNRLGANEVDIHYTASDAPIVIQSKNAKLVLMPMRSTGPKEEETKKGAVQAIVTSGSKSSAERALEVLDAIEKKIGDNTYSDPLLLTVFAKLAIKLARQLIKGGMAINQAIRQAVADARKQMPDAPDDDAEVASSLQTAIDEEERGMRRGGVKTKRGQVMDTVDARPGLTPETQADAIALTQSIIQESGLKASQLPGENLFRPSADFEQEIEGRKFLEIMKREMERATLDGRQERLSNLINSVREHFEESQAFSPSLQSDLYLAGQSKASELGRGLGALAMDAKELGKVARNIRGELTRILFSRFNGETIQKLMDRIIVQFRDMFTDAELDQLSSDDPRLAGIMKKIQAASARDTGGRVYRAVQARLKPKPTLKQGQKERKAREDEAIDQIIENALALGVKEPAPKPGNKLTPDERLGLMTRPATQVKIQEATEKAVAESEFNAGWKMMEADASSDSEADLAELAERKAAGETPDEDAIERGLALPEFAHWKTIRDGFLNYSPTTLKLVREVIKGRFKGTKFDDPKVSKPETRIDLNALAREPDAEVDRTIAAQLAAVGAIMEVNGATPETKARVLKMVQQDIAAQVQIARGRIVEGFLSPAERTAPKSASQKLRELLNAGLTKDPRYQSQKTRDLLKRVVDSITTADQFAGMAGQPRASKLSFMEAKLAQAVAAEPSLDDWMKAAVWTRLTERMLDAESSLATRLAGGKDVSFEARAAQTPEEREAAHRKSVNRLTEGVRAGLLDQRIVDEVSQKPVFQRLTPTLRDLVRTVMETPVSGQAGLAKAFSNVIVSQMAIDPALADKVGAGLAQAYAAKFKAARGRALTQALATLTPKERREFNPGKPLFRAIQNAVNAGGFDTSSALQQIAKDHKWNIPSDAEVAKIRALADEEQRLRGDNDEKAAATLPARSRLISEMRTRWARMSNPFSDRTVRAEAAGELMSANLLLRMAFATKQVLDVGTQLFHDTGTRAYAAAAELYENDKSEGRETRFWKDMSSALKDATESRLGSVKMALSEAKGALKGQTVRDQALGITSEVRLLERMVLRANEAEADGEHVKAFALRLVAALRFSFRVASSMDAFQGVGVEQQSMREQVIAGLRDQGKTPEEASKIAKTVMGDMASEFALAQATVSLDPDVSEADRSAAAWNVVKARQYARMASAQLDVEGFQKTNETLRSLVGWNLPETGGPGMILAAPMGWANTLMKEAGIPYRLPFANAIATGVNRATTFAGGGFIPSMYGTSPWFATPKDRIQRKAEAAVGLSLMSAVGFAALAGLIQAFTDWPDDPDERNLWEREGHRPNTVEFHYGDGKFLRLSMNTGPVAILRPMLAGIAAAQQLARKREKQNEAGRKKADKDGTEFTPVPLATEDVMIAAAWAAWNGIFRTRTTAGMVGSGADYSTFSPKKTLVSAAGSLIPFAPLAREAGMLAGANVDPKKADVVDLLLPTPGSGAARRNFLGDPVGTPRAAERIASILTGGTAIAGGKDEPAYRLLKETGWRPQTPSATRLWTIGDKLRALTPEEYATFEKVRGTTLKAGLNEIANRGVTGKDALDEIKQVDKEAVQAAKEAVGVD